MNKKPYFLTLGRALLFALLSSAAGSALATATFGSRVDTYCATQPTQATAPQQSRPFRASGSSCGLCHTNPSNPTINNLNAFGSASLSCTGTTCGATVNPFCVAHAPSNATITAPAAGTTVAQGQSLTFTAGNPTNPDGFPLSFSWMFTGGMPNATGQSVSVPMTVAGSITSTLEVRNSVGMLATGTTPTRTVTVTGGGGGNQPPVATITAPTGNVTIAQGGTVTFQGSGTDPDNNTPLTYSWNFGGGAPNSTAQNPGAVTFNTAGTFTVTFTVTDSLGLSSTPVTRMVTVTGGGGGNQPPVATISSPTGNVTIQQGGSVTFQGSGTDPNNNTPLTYNWNFGGGAPNSTQQNPGSVTFNTAGTFTVTFTVTDSLGLSSAAVTRTVTVTAPANMAPTATINSPTGNVTIQQGGSVTFQGSGSDPDNNLPLTYSWNFGGGASNSTQQNPGSVTFNTAGTFTVTFTVTDSRGLSSTPVTRTVTVTSTTPTPVPGAPVATILEPAGNVTIVQGDTVTFRGMGTASQVSSTRDRRSRESDDDEHHSDDDGGTGGTLTLRYNWNFGGGASNSTLQNPGAVRFNTVGTFTVTFTVTDSLGRVSAPVTRIVTVTAPQLPVAMIVAPAMDVSVLPGGTVTFSGSGTGSQITYRWQFPGGSPSSSTRQSPGAVRFSTPGSYTVTLTVTDRRGRASTPVTRVITVAQPNQAPHVDEDCVKADEVVTPPPPPPPPPPTPDRDGDHHRDRHSDGDDD